MSKAKELWSRYWELESGNKIGQGGQGVVRKVIHIQSKKIGALKELINYTSTERRKRMHIEAQSLKVLDHPNIAKLLDSDTESNGRIYLVTEYIDGATLESRINEKRFCLEEMLSFARIILDALHHAHSINVFHRDIKPENIILRNLDPQNPILIDFGISFNEEDSIFSSASYDGQQLGNRFLHLPELHRGARDPRADITQFCGVLLYSLTGTIPISLVDENGLYPHQIESARLILDNSITQQSVKNKLLRLFDKAFQVRIDDRWQTVNTLIEALEKIGMTETDEEDIYSLASVRQSIESDPALSRQTLTKVIFDQYMTVTGKVVNLIVTELGSPLATTQQGGARCNLNEQKFGSHFGVNLPKFQVNLRINGALVGDEIVMSIEDDEDDFFRSNLDNIDWNEYIDSLRKKFILKINENNKK